MAKPGAGLARRGRLTGRKKNKRKSDSHQYERFCFHLKKSYLVILNRDRRSKVPLLIFVPLCLRTDGCLKSALLLLQIAAFTSATLCGINDLHGYAVCLLSVCEILPYVICSMVSMERPVTACICSAKKPIDFIFWAFSRLASLRPSSWPLARPLCSASTIPVR